MSHQGHFHAFYGRFTYAIQSAVDDATANITFQKISDYALNLISTEFHFLVFYYDLILMCWFTQIFVYVH